MLHPLVSLMVVKKTRWRQPPPKEMNLAPENRPLADIVVTVYSGYTPARMSLSGH